LNPVNTYQLFAQTQYLPTDWDLIAQDNIFLSKKYLEVFELAAPTNMKCQYIGIFMSEELIGIALAQFIDLSHLESYGERDKKIKTWLRNYIFKRFSSQLLFIGNNTQAARLCIDFTKNWTTKNEHRFYRAWHDGLTDGSESHQTRAYPDHPRHA
jgi:hypothetical protein